MPWLWDQLAEDRTLRGCRILARGRVVITNRLHAHLLCTMMGLPHVVCDTSNGKVFAYRDTWIRDRESPHQSIARFANTPAEAVEMAAQLAAMLSPH
jgi:pyruvyl transferase EpsO